MILFQNRLIVLDYSPSTDVLSVEWPSVSAYDLPEVEQSLNTLVEYIRNYDVKRLLIDSTKAAISPELDMVEYQAIVTEFAHRLTKTRLQKSARIMHADLVREKISREIGDQVSKKANLKLENRNFYNRVEALAWLTA
ncbi:hypothetical protein TH61_05555 [Rufibacter sp. DG15C]|uniref:hypothetical protein n=1 Tax=Rufibacter sp. DG15C TaxID=1379909 RepID=UPI00078D76B5|nr:hypothetical protein [Rufibacter sp. DG15C]AMM50751.1 hypothetical protein TH61_05555 [Rufibacter sp. DG15C]